MISPSEAASRQCAGSKGRVLAEKTQDRSKDAGFERQACRGNAENGSAARRLDHTPIPLGGALGLVQ
jgi:hypothetical protein